jgi:hypothetical protein
LKIKTDVAPADALPVKPKAEGEDTEMIKAQDGAAEEGQADDAKSSAPSSPLTPLSEEALVSVTIEQHVNYVRAWTAFPWHQYTSAYNVKGAPAPNPLRLKGWQSSLVSSVIDLVWMLPGNRSPEEWIPGYTKIVGKMFEVVDQEEEDEGVEEMLKRDIPIRAPDLPLPAPKPHHQHYYGVISTPAAAATATTAAAPASPAPVDESSMGIDEDLDFEDEVDQGDLSADGSEDYTPGKRTSRSAGKKRKEAPAPVEEEFHDPSKRRRLGAGMYDESRNVVMPGVQNLIAVTTAAAMPQQLVDPVKKSHKRKAPETRFLELCERGWNRLKMKEKLALLKFLIEEVVCGEDAIRLVFFEACFFRSELTILSPC